MFGPDDAHQVITRGAKMAKKRNPVYLLRQDKPFEVATNEGVLSGKAGDFLAHDPMSGHLWPVAADYVAMHYEDF